jgi:hypothetical protein
MVFNFVKQRADTNPGKPPDDRFRLESFDHGKNGKGWPGAFSGQSLGILNAVIPP